MNQADSLPRAHQQLQKALLVILLFQAVFLIAQLLNDGSHSNAMVGALVATIAVSAANRRIFSDSQERHATFYITLWRYGAIVLVGAITVLVALRAYAPNALPNGSPTLIAMFLSSFIALKGAVLGKLKPGAMVGLRLRWTLQSRLAWEMAHRLLGRILFFGGLLVLVASPFIHYALAFIAVGVIVIGGVTAATIESWRVWRDDPERDVSTT